MLIFKLTWLAVQIEVWRFMLMSHQPTKHKKHKCNNMPNTLTHTHTHTHINSNITTFLYYTEAQGVKLWSSIATYGTCRLVTRSISLKHENTSFIPAAIQLVVTLNPKSKQYMQVSPIHESHWVIVIIFNQCSLFHKIFHSKYKYIAMWHVCL